MRISLRRGFSLIELIVVLVILGIVTGLATLTLRSHLDRAAVTRTVNTLAEADRRARATALQLPPGKVALQFKQGFIDARPVNRKYFLPRGIELEPLFGSRNRVTFHTNGTSESYAVRIDRGDLSLWFATLGLTGQCLVFDSEEECRNVLEQ